MQVEGQGLNRLVVVWKPFKAEMFEHNLTHILCRNWCGHCVKGRVANDLHPQRVGSEGDIVVSSIDDFWMSEGNVDPEWQEEKQKDITEPSKWWKSEESGTPIFIMKDGKSKAIFV